MKHITAIFVRGLFALLPIVITVAVLVWLFMMIENAFAAMLTPVMGDSYFTGLGVILSIVLVFLVGIAMGLWLTRALVKWFEHQFKKLPLVKTLYSSVQDMLGLFSGKQSEDLNRVVMVSVGDHRILGFVTRDTFDDLPEGVGEQDKHVAVYLPMGYQLGGYTTIIERDKVTSIDMSLEDAMKFALTAGVKAEDDEKKPAKKVDNRVDPS